MNLSIFDNSIVYLALDEDMPLDYYCSKLCFLNNCANKHNGEVIRIQGDSQLHYDPVQNVYNLPYNINVFQKCFLLRLIIDAEQLKRENLPIHAAAISDGDRVFIIAAPPGGGKSFLANTISPDFVTIGDDHIIISPTHIQGNLRRRIRNECADITGYVANSGYCNFSPITWICYTRQEANCTPVFLQGKDAFKAFTDASAFKYLNETFLYNSIRFPAALLTNFDISKTYQKCFDLFLKRDRVLLVQGTLEHAVSTLAEIIN